MLKDWIILVKIQRDIQSGYCEDSSIYKTVSFVQSTYKLEDLARLD